MTRTGASLHALLVALTAGCTAQVAPGSSSQQAQAVDECASGAVEGCTVPSGTVSTRACEPGQDGYVWGACGPASCTGTQLACVTQHGKAGVASCNVANEASSACGEVTDCQPWAIRSVGMEGCEEQCMLSGGTWAWAAQPCNTPLVLAFDDERVAFTHASGEFDLAGRDASIATDWVSAETPWLALDLDGNGRIDDGRELFGSMTELPGGGRAPNGFVALAALDDDHDGQITERDAAFERLLVWRDRDQDRRSSPAELSTAKDAGLVAIRLDFRAVPRCEDGDCEVERARFVFRDARGIEREGAVIDVHLASR